MTWNAVSTSSPEIPLFKVTVIVLVAVTPSPALILLIPTWPPVGPTILYSSILGWISNPSDGQSGEIVLPEAGPYASPTFS